MKMRIVLGVLALLIIALFGTNFRSQAQNSYHLFTFEGKEGVVDTAENMVMEPLDNVDFISEEKDCFIFHLEDQPTQVFDRRSGQSQSYDFYYYDDLTIQDTGYSSMKKNGQYFLENIETGKRHRLPIDRAFIKSVGDYYYISKTIREDFPESERGPKTGMLLPPSHSSIDDDTYFLLFKNPLDKTAFFKTPGSTFDDPIVLYERSEEEQGKRPIKYYVFPKDTIVRVFDATLQPITKLVVGHSSSGWSGKVSDQLEEDLTINEQAVYPTIGASPSNQPQEYPTLVEENEGEERAFYWIKSDRPGDGLLLFTTPYDENHFTEKRIQLSYQDQPEAAAFDYDLRTGKIYFPKQLKEQVEITWGKPE